MKTIISRLLSYCNVNNIRQSDLVNFGCGSKQTVSNVWNQKNEPNAFLLSKLLEHETKLNARWLLTGEGEMITKKEYSDTEPYGKCLYCAEKEKRIKDLEMHRDDLRKQVQQFEFDIGNLKRKSG